MVWTGSDLDEASVSQRGSRWYFWYLVFWFFFVFFWATADGAARDFSVWNSNCLLGQRRLRVTVPFFGLRVTVFFSSDRPAAARAERVMGQPESRSLQRYNGWTPCTCESQLYIHIHTSQIQRDQAESRAGIVHARMPRIVQSSKNFSYFRRNPNHARSSDQTT